MESTVQSEELIVAYIRALDGQVKSSGMIDRFVSDPALRNHILQTEAAFPAYRFEVRRMAAQGDLVAVHATFHGVHKGTFAGIPATGRAVSEDLMIFYRVEGDRIAEHWMQMNFASLMNQLTGPAAAVSQN